MKLDIHPNTTALVLIDHSGNNAGGFKYWTQVREYDAEGNKISAREMADQNTTDAVQQAVKAGFTLDIDGSGDDRQYFFTRKPVQTKCPFCGSEVYPRLGGYAQCNKTGCIWDSESEARYFALFQERASK